MPTGATTLDRNVRACVCADGSRAVIRIGRIRIDSPYRIFEADNIEQIHGFTRTIAAHSKCPSRCPEYIYTCGIPIPSPHSHTAAKSTSLSRTETGCWNSQIAEDNPAIGSSDRAKNTRKILGGFTQCECREARRRHADAVSKCGCPKNNSIADIRINMLRG